MCFSSSRFLYSINIFSHINLCNNGFYTLKLYIALWASVPNYNIDIWNILYTSHAVFSIRHEIWDIWIILPDRNESNHRLSYYVIGISISESQLFFRQNILAHVIYMHGWKQILLVFAELITYFSQNLYQWTLCEEIESVITIPVDW